MRASVYVKNNLVGAIVSNSLPSIKAYASKCCNRYHSAVDRMVICSKYHGHALEVEYLRMNHIFSNGEVQRGVWK